MPLSAAGLLRAANERIAYLESSGGATRAQAQISALRKQMLDKKAEGLAKGGNVPIDAKSKACIVQ